MKRIIVLSVTGLILALVPIFLIQTRPTPQSVRDKQTPELKAHAAVPLPSPPVQTALAQRTSSSTNETHPLALISVPSPAASTPFTDFSDWAKRYLSGQRSFSGMQGEALAWKRQQALLEL